MTGLLRLQLLVRFSSATTLCLCFGVPMSDTLRDRIAAVLIEAAEFRGVYQLHNPDMRFLADAVIEALGLRIQVAGPDGIVGTGDYRYVTEWTTDE